MDLLQNYDILVGQNDFHGPEIRKVHITTAAVNFHQLPVQLDLKKSWGGRQNHVSSLDELVATSKKRLGDLGHGLAMAPAAPAPSIDDICFLPTDL